MKTILVTGASGYIGRQVIRELSQGDAHIQLISIDKNSFNNVDGVQSFEADIFDPEFDVASTIGCVPDVCLHLAWRNGFNHNDKTHILDLSSHYCFLTNLAKAGTAQIAVMGSMHEVGYWEGPITQSTPCNPRSLYGIAKNALRQSLELSFKDTDVVFQWLRAFYIYGNDEHSQSIFGKILRAAQSGETVFPFTSGQNKYDFISIEELAYQIAMVVLQDSISGIINCCSGCPVSLADQVESFIREHELDIVLEYGAYPDRPYDSPAIWGDTSAIESVLSRSS